MEREISWGEFFEKTKTDFKEKIRQKSLRLYLPFVLYSITIILLIKLARIIIWF